MEIEEGHRFRFADMWPFPCGAVWRTGSLVQGGGFKLGDGANNDQALNFIWGF